MFGNPIALVTTAGSARRRDDDAWAFAMTSVAPEESSTRGRRAMTVSTPAFTVTRVQPETLRGSAALPLENAATSTHSSAVERFDPIHITSLTAIFTGADGAGMTAGGSVTEPDPASAAPDAVAPDPAAMATTTDPVDAATAPDDAGGRRTIAPESAAGTATDPLDDAMEGEGVSSALASGIH